MSASVEPAGSTATSRSGPPRHARVAVIGAGITGLATAFALLRTENGRPLDVVVFEAGPRPGGKLSTIEVGGVPVEAGADSFVVRKPWAVELCRELGLEDEVVVPGALGAFVWTRGRLIPFPERSAFGIPAGPGALLRWPGLTMPARLRGVADLFVPARRDSGDVALGTFLRRRLGDDAARVLVEPLLAGLHAGDPERLSLDATFPELGEWERGHDSLLLGARAVLKAAAKHREGRRPMFASVWGGLDRLVAGLVDSIGPHRLRTDAPAASLRVDRDAFAVEAGGSTVRADAVVLATPAFESARLVRQANPEAAAVLGAIPYASTAVVLLVYPRGTAARLPEGTGFVVPDGEGTMTACTWVSRKWPQEAYQDRAVLRCFVGRAGNEDALALSDDRLIDRVAAEVEAASPVGAGPEAARIVRWNRGMPQYEVGHLGRLAALAGALRATPGLFVAGSALGGIGIADCVRQARGTGQSVRAFLGGSTSEGRSEGSRMGEAMSWTT